MHDISKRMLANVPDLVMDLLELAAYVYSADWATCRGGEASRANGCGVAPEVPVRHSGSKARALVIGACLDALSEALGFLTEDEYQFEFEEHRGSPPEVQEYLELGDEAPARFEPDEVVLFSGGLDSLAGVVEWSLARTRRQRSSVIIRRPRSPPGKSSSSPR